MNLMEIGQEVVALCNAGQDETVMERFYAPDIVSIEGQDSPEMPARIEGVGAVKQKWDWWYNNNEVHSTRAFGPYIGLKPDQFLVRFEMDTTPKGGERTQMDELACYTVKDGKIVEEAFSYNMQGMAAG